MQSVRGSIAIPNAIALIAFDTFYIYQEKRKNMAFFQYQSKLNGLNFDFSLYIE